MAFIKKEISAWEIKHGQIALTGSNYEQAVDLFEPLIEKTFDLDTFKGFFTNKHFIQGTGNSLRLSCMPFFKRLNIGQVIYLEPIAETTIKIYEYEPEEKYKFDERLQHEEDELSSIDDYGEIPPTDIVAFNELRSCADIVRMYNNGQLTIQPDFQREIVWKKPDQTRFIDSLIKQLPIPSMCISLDFNTNERFVIDGLQRISTIISFLTNDEYFLSELKDIDPKISGKTVSLLKSKHRTLYDRVENLTIPITVLRCNHKKRTHLEYLFTIFHRLNSGGAKLNNQEIRNCIYNGKLNTLLKETVKYPNYKHLFNIVNDKSYRFAFEELNLRFFAFSDWLYKYNGRLAKFLNDYMFEKDKDLDGGISETEIEEKRRYFKRTIDIVFEKLFDKRNIENLSKAIIEAILIGVGKNIEYIESLSNNQAQKLLNRLRNDDFFSVDNLKEGLSQKTKVVNRINRAIEIFSGSN